MIATLLMFWFSAEMGMELDNGAWYYWEADGNGEYHELVRDDGTYYTDLTARITALQVLYFEANVRTRISASDSSALRFDPFYVDYWAEAGAQFGPVTVGWRHLCYHPIYTYSPIRAQRRYPVEGWFDQVFIRIQGGNR